MLILKNIIKEYNVADTKVAALKGINIALWDRGRSVSKIAKNV